MFNKKIKRVGTVSEFMSGSHKKKNVNKLSVTIPLFLAPTTIAVPSVFADSPSAMINAVPVTGKAVAVAASPQQTIMHAFDPLIDMIQSLAYPIAGVMLAAGCLYIMTGFKDKGMDMLKNAAIGYLLVMLSPMFLKILVQMGSQII